MIQLTRAATVCTGTDAHQSLRRHFDAQQCICIPGFLEPDLARAVASQAMSVDFYPKTDAIAADLWMPENNILALLHMLLNDEKLFELIRQITGCEPIGCFSGRVYRLIPGAGHYVSWHNDDLQDRLIGISVNLSAAPFSGGLFEIRDLELHRVLYSGANRGLGDAILFRIGEHLQHRVTPLAGTEDRTALAGWFRSRPRFAELLKGDGPSLQPQ